MAYLISEEAQDLLQDVKNFCEKEVVEQCKAYDVSGEWPKEIYDKAIEQGYQALEVPEDMAARGYQGGCGSTHRADGNCGCWICNYHFRQRTWHETGADRRK